MVSINIQLENTPQVLNKLQRVANVSESATQDWIDRAANLFLEYIGQYAPRDTSTLAHSFVKIVQSGVADVGSNLAYAQPENIGRSAGARMPPSANLIGWIQRHGLQPRDKLGRFQSPKSLAWIIAKRISERGIPGTYYFDKAFERLEADLPELTLQVSGKIEAAWSEA